MLRIGVDAQHVEDGFLAVASVPSGVDTNGRELATFTPTLNSKRGDS